MLRHIKHDSFLQSEIAKHSIILHILSLHILSLAKVMTVQTHFIHFQSSFLSKSFKQILIRHADSVHTFSVFISDASAVSLAHSLKHLLSSQSSQKMSFFLSPRLTISDDMSAVVVDATDQIELMAAPYNNFNAVLKEYNPVEVMNLTDESDEYQSGDMQEASVLKSSQNGLASSIHKNLRRGDSEGENLIFFIFLLVQILMNYRNTNCSRWR